MLYHVYGSYRYEYRFLSKYPSSVLETSAKELDSFLELGGQESANYATGTNNSKTAMVITLLALDKVQLE